MNQKRFQFNGTAGGYFVVTIVGVLTAYIPIFGWPIGFNFQYKWLADNLLIDGKKVQYKAGYGETLSFLFVNVLLTIITLGIYSFWFAPKTYRYVLDHSSYVEDSVMPVESTPTPVQTVEIPQSPVEPPTTPVIG